MKVISATTIGKLIEAHMEGDDQKFMSYANFIAEAYEEAGEERKAKIIRSRIDGSYKKQTPVVLDKSNTETLLKLVELYAQKNYERPKEPYLLSTGSRYYGEVHSHGYGLYSDGHGNFIEYR